MINYADQAPAVVMLVAYLFGLAAGILGSPVFGSVQR
jgi:hypothetical protein